MKSGSSLQTGLLVLACVLFRNAENAVLVVESFAFAQRVGSGVASSTNRCHSSSPSFGAIGGGSRRRTTSLLFLSQQRQQQQARRWNGNYKHASNKLSDVPKSKKLMLNLTANGVTKTLEKKRMETLQHVLTKAMIWKLFMNDYPDLEIELDIGDPDYLPDVIATTTTTTATTYNGTEVVFWGESGRMKMHKALDLMRRYPNAHIVHCRWAIDVESFMVPFVEYLETQLFEEDTSWWEGRFSFASLPLEVWEFIDEDSGTILIEKSDLKWRELDLSQLDFSRISDEKGTAS
eukprot:jgi/Psemu1/189708/e_gw1.92.6.1